MYGLIGTAIKKLVETELGEDTWITICEKAGFSEKDFVQMDNYDDAVIFGVTMIWSGER